MLAHTGVVSADQQIRLQGPTNWCERALISLYNSIAGISQVNIIIGCWQCPIDELTTQLFQLFVTSVSLAGWVCSLVSWSLGSNTAPLTYYSILVTCTLPAAHSWHTLLLWYVDNEVYTVSSLICYSYLWIDSHSPWLIAGILTMQMNSAFARSSSALSIEIHLILLTMDSLIAAGSLRYNTSFVIL